MSIHITAMCFRTVLHIFGTTLNNLAINPPVKSYECLFWGRKSQCLAHPLVCKKKKPSNSSAIRKTLRIWSRQNAYFNHVEWFSADRYHIDIIWPLPLSLSFSSLDLVCNSVLENGLKTYTLSFSQTRVLTKIENWNDPCHTSLLHGRIAQYVTQP